MNLMTDPLKKSVVYRRETEISTTGDSSVSLESAVVRNRCRLRPLLPNDMHQQQNHVVVHEFHQHMGGYLIAFHFEESQGYSHWMGWWL
jgi:hypothetical protein